MWGPPVGVSGALGRVAGAAEHRAVADVERRTARGQRHDVVDGQVSSRVGGALVARADVAVLPDVPGDHSLGQARPSWVRVDAMVGTDARESRVLAAAAARSAGHDAADRAELHAVPMSTRIAARQPAHDSAAHAVPAEAAHEDDRLGAGAGAGAGGRRRRETPWSQPGRSGIAPRLRPCIRAPARLALPVVGMGGPPGAVVGTPPLRRHASARRANRARSGAGSPCALTRSWPSAVRRGRRPG